MAATDTTLNIMLFEGGALINALSDKPQGVALAAKVEHADRNAFAAGQTDFALTLDPVEVGMALDALLRAESGLSRDLGRKLGLALSETMDRLGLSYQQGPSQPSLGDDGGALSNPTPEPDEPAPASEKPTPAPAAEQAEEQGLGQEEPAEQEEQEEPAERQPSENGEKDPDAL